MEKPVAGTGSPRKRDDEPVVAPAAADRTEMHRASLLVLGLDQKFNFDTPGQCSIRGRGRRMESIVELRSSS